MWMRHCTDYVSDICCFNGGIWNDPRTACIGGCLLSNLPYYVPPSFREKHQALQVHNDIEEIGLRMDLGQIIDDDATIIMTAMDNNGFG